MNRIYILAYSVWLLGSFSQDATAASATKKVCHYLGQEFQVNELVTGDVCDECYCTQYGIMCQLKACPPANCENKVRGQCCWECPIETKMCHYNGEHGTVAVPETGCQYTDGKVCHCYHDNAKGESVGETMCFPPFPGSIIPACNATTSTK